MTITDRLGHLPDLATPALPHQPATSPTLPTDEDRRAAAISYAERGWSVVRISGLVRGRDSNLICACPLGRLCDDAGKHPPSGSGVTSTDSQWDPRRWRTGGRRTPA